MNNKNTFFKPVKNTLNAFKGYSLMLLMCFPFFLFGQASGDYRTNTANATWSTASHWDIYNGSSWSTASLKPTASNSVYIQSGHTVTLTGNEACNDLNLNTTSEQRLILATSTLSVNGKLRAYSGASGTIPGPNDTPSSKNDWITSTTGKISIVGNSRNLTYTGEWGSGNAGVASPNGFDLDINLTSGQTATLNTNIKARNITVVSGTLDAASNRLSPDQGTAGTGNLTIQTGAIVISSASGTISQVTSRLSSAGTPAGTFNLNAGGILRLTGTTPTVDMNTINLNGTVEYTSSSAQNLVTAFTTYTNLTVANNTKTAPVNITINGTYQINQGGYGTGGTWTYGSSSTLVFNNTSGPYGPINSSHVYWPASNGPTNVTIQGAGGIDLGVSRTVSGIFQTAAGVTLSSGATLTLNGTAQLNTGGFFNNSPTYGSSSTLVYNTSATFGNGNEWTSSSNTVGVGAPKNVTIQTSGTSVTLSAHRSVIGNLTISTGATLTLSSSGHNLYLYGDFTQNGTITSNNSTLVFSGASTQTINASSGTLSVNAINDQMTGGGQLTFGNTDVTLTSSSTAFTTASNTLIQLAGRTLTFSGGGSLVPASGTIIGSNANGANIVFNAATTISTCANCLTLGALTTVKLNAGVDFGSSTTAINYACQINAGGFVNTNAPTYGSASTLIYNSGTNYGSSSEWKQNATSGAGVPQNVTINNATTLNFGAQTGYRQANGDMTINSGGTFALSTGIGGDVKLGGNWANSGTFTPNSRAVFFVGASTDQTITKTGGETFDYVGVDKAAGSVLLANDMTCNQTLTLTNGKITTSANKVIISSSGSVARTNGWVIGNLQKNVATGATTRAFELGDASNYTPLNISFGNVTTAGNLTAKTTLGAHPNIGTSLFNNSTRINRYWTATNSGIVFNNYQATLTFVAGDVVGGANTSALKLGKYDPSTWTYPTVSSNTATTATATGMTGFSDFVLAECASITTFNVTGTGSYCAGGAGLAVGLSGSQTGVNYQLIKDGSNAGSPVAGTGSALNFGTQTVGTYTVSATNAANCTATMSGNAVLTTNPVTVIGTQPATTQTVCQSAAATNISVAATGTSLSYQWYSNTSNANSGGTLISGSISINYAPPTSSSGTTYYYCIVTGTCGTVSSNTSAVVVNSTSVGGTVAGGTAVCTGTNSTALSLSGNTGGVMKWQSSTVSDFSSNVTEITSNTTTSLTATNLTATTYYRAVVQSGVCAVANSSVATVSVNPLPTITLGTVAAICTGTTSFSVPYSATANGANQFSITTGSNALSGFSAIANQSLTSTPLSISIPNGSATGVYDFNLTVRNSTTGCISTVYAFTLTINVLPTASIGGTTTLCANATAPLITFTGANGVAPYTFIYTLNGGGNQTITTTSGNSITLAQATSAAGTFAYALVSVADANCSQSQSGTATVTVNATTAISAQPATTQTVCQSITPTDISVTATGTSLTYQWYSNVSNSNSGGTLISSALSSSYTPITTISSTTYYYCIVTGTCGTVTSNTSAVIVTPTATPSVSIAITGGSNPSCALPPSSITFTATPTNGGAAPLYQWKRNGSNLMGLPSPNPAIFTPMTPLADGDVITVVMTSNAVCANPTIVTSNGITIVINQPPTINLGMVTAICAGTNSFNIPYSSTLNSPNQFSLTTGSSALSSFSNISNQSLTSTPLSISIPNGSVGGTYDFNLSVRNSTTGCTSGIYPLSLTINSPSVAPTASVTQPSCTTATGTISVTSSTSGLSFSIDGSAYTNTTGVFTSVPANATYSLTAKTTATMCISAPLNVTVNAQPATPNAPTVASIDQPHCISSGGTTLGDVTLTAVSGEQYSIDGGPYQTSNQFFSLSPATYSIRARNASGCVSSATSVTINPRPAVPASQTVAFDNGSAYCAGGTGVQLRLSGSETGVDYQIKDGVGGNNIGSSVAGTGNALALGVQTAAGNYVVYAVKTDGCTSIMPQTPLLSIIPLPTVYAVSGGGAYCAGGTGVAVGLGNSQMNVVNYQLKKNGVNVGSPVTGTGNALSFGLQTAAGTYTVEATNSFGCVATMSGSAVISISPLPTTPTANVTQPTCTTPTGAINVSSSISGLTFSIDGSDYSNATGIFSGLTPTNAYNLTAKNANMCVSAPLNLTINAVSANPTITGILATSIGSTTQLTGSGSPATSNPWMSASTGVATVSSSGLVTGVSTGSSIITYTDANGCSTTATVNVNASLWDAYAILGGNYYDLLTATSNPDFQGHNLGTFVQGGSLLFNGGQIKTNTVGTANVCSGKIWYSIYPASGSVGTFSSETFSDFVSAFGNNDAGFYGLNSPGDKAIQGNSGTANILNGLAIGNYKIAVYVNATGSNVNAAGCEVDPLITQNNGGNYWIADFSVAPCVPPSITSQSTNAVEFCQSPSFITLSVTATGSNLTYQWYSNTNNSNSGGTIDPHGEMNDYLFLPTVGTVYYYCVVSGTCGPSVSSAVSGAIVVHPTSVGGTVAGNATVCSGTNSTMLSLSGNTGGVVKWQSSTDNFATAPTDISNVTTSLTAINLTTTTYYRAVVESGTCPSVFSSVAIVTVNPALTPSVLIAISTGSNPTCTGSSVIFTATPTNGGTSPSYQWKKDGTNVGTNANTYTDAGTTGGVITCVMTVGTGICTNAPTATSSGITLSINPTVAAGALKFDGSDDYVNIDGGFDKQVFTIEMWLKPNASQGAYADIIDNNHQSNINWVCQSTGGNTYIFGANGAGVNFTLTADVWQHLVLVKEDKMIRVYINGTLTGSAYHPNAVNYNGAQTLKLGAWGGGGRNWNGEMDEVRIWERALCADEINDHKNCELSGTQTGLWAYYKFNQGVIGCDNASSITLTDETGNHNGTLSGFALTGSTSNYVAGNVSGACPSVGSSTLTTYYRDADGDGLGDPSVSAHSCGSVAGFVTDNTDCDDAISATAGGIVSGSTTVCAGTNGGTLTVSGNTVMITKWQSSTVGDFSSNVTDIVNTTSSQPYANLTATTYYRAVIVSNACVAAKATSATITVTPSPSAPTTTTVQPTCSVPTGTIEVISSPDMYSFDNGSNYGTNAISSALNAGTYAVKVKNAADCPSPATSVTIDNQPLTPTITLGSVSDVCTAATSFSLPYSATTGSPTRFSIATGTRALSAFVPIVSATLAASPLSINVPSGSSAGTYDFDLTVTNAATCVSAIVPFTVTLGSTTANGGTVSGSTSVCAGTNSGSLSLSGYSGSITKWQSSTVSDFSSAVTDIFNTLSNQSFANLSVTTHYRAVISDGSCGTANSSVATITVNALPTPSIVGLNSAYCKNAAPITLLGSPSGGDFTIDGNSATLFDPSVWATTSHTVVYTYTDVNTCSASATQNVSVNATATIVTSPLSVTRCPNANATFTASATGSALSYQWQVSTNGGSSWTDIGGQMTVTLSLSSVTLAMNGRQYRLKVNENSSCPVYSNAATLTVSNPSTPLSITVDAGDLIICSGNSRSVTATPTGGTMPYATYVWSEATGGTFTPSTNQTATVNYTPPTTTGGKNLRVLVTDANGCAASSNTFTNLSVYGTPILTVSPTPQTVCSGSSSATITTTNTNRSIGGSNITWSVQSSNSNVNIAALTLTAAMTNANSETAVTLPATTFTNTQTTVQTTNITFTARTSEGCTNTAAAVISVGELLSADAGLDIKQSGATFTLNAAAPPAGTGRWSVVSPNTFAASNISALTNRNATVSNVPSNVAVTLRWTVTQGSCSPVFDDVVLTRTEVALDLKALLAGALNTTTFVMKDGLRGVIPTSSSTAYAGTNETVSNAVLANTNAQTAVVDWVLIELRSNPSTVVGAKAALILRNGDIVATDGFSNVTLNVLEGSYYIAIRHRNHLGVMTAAPIAFSLPSAMSTMVDFSHASTATYGTNAQKTYNSGAVRALYAGDANGNSVVLYNGNNSDRSAIQARLGASLPSTTTAVRNGYYREDINMNGQVKLNGTDNDRILILNMIGGSSTSASSVTQQF